MAGSSKAAKNESYKKKTQHPVLDMQTSDCDKTTERFKNSLPAFFKKIQTMRFIKFNDSKIAEIKKALDSFSIREAARQTNVSYYTAWCVARGKYDSGGTLQTFNNFHYCPITGFKL